MTKRRNQNPYSHGLLVGVELDTVIVDKNGNPFPAKDILDKEKYSVFRKFGTTGVNVVKPMRDMVRIYCANSHCRAWSTDNVWASLKQTVILLKKRGFISFEAKSGRYTAGSNIRLAIKDAGIYKTKAYELIAEMIGTNKSSKLRSRLIRNLHLTVGLVNCLLDRREGAEQRRKLYGPGTDKCFRSTDRYFSYQGLSNLALYSPALLHLMLGCARLAVHITLNDNTYRFCKISEFSLNHIEESIRTSNYDAVENIWDTVKDRYIKMHTTANDNPLNSERIKTIDFLIQHGLGVLGPSPYDNWRLKVKKDNYQSHMAQLPTWESGIGRKLLNKNQDYKEFKKHGTTSRRTSKQD